uniref:Ubiquitin-like protease family profile domain-containing protein n=1 Tax=Glossina brevipalpis TaxID=37001 RepID=A0A1A9W0Y2_9MUSC
MFDERSIGEARARILGFIIRTPPPLSTVTRALKRYAAIVNTGNLELVAICHECDLAENARIEPLTPDEITVLTAVLAHDELVRTSGILSERRLMSFFIVLGSDGNTTEHEFIRATLTMVSTIEKNSFTDAWVSSRWNALITDAPDMSESYPVPIQTLTQYSNIFQICMPNYQAKISTLVYNHHLAKTAGLDTLMRIIQQSRVPHVAGLNAICELVIRPTSTDEDYQHSNTSFHSSNTVSLSENNCSESNVFGDKAYAMGVRNENNCSDRLISRPEPNWELISRPEPNWELVCKQSRRISPLDKDSLLIHVCIHNHWRLFIIIHPNPETKKSKIYIIDSLPEYPNLEIVMNIRRYLKYVYHAQYGVEISIDETTLPSYEMPVPRQPSRNDCGIYTIKNLERYLCRGDNAWDPADFQVDWCTVEEASRARMEIAALILRLSGEMKGAKTKTTRLIGPNAKKFYSALVQRDQR